MAYTTIDDPTAYFQTAIWSGTGSALSVTFDGNSDMQPDMVWVKNRTVASDHRLSDSVRGTSSHLVPNGTDAQDSSSTALTAFNSDGFSVGSEQSYSKSGSNHVGWSWKAGTSFTNDASATGIGSIDSSGSVNETAGFSICTHTGTGSLGTIKHGLSTKPSVILTKERSEARDWMMYHHKNTSAPATDFLLLNTTDATVDNDNFMNDTEPTSSVFTVKGFSEVNKASQTYVSYIFSERQGYSKFGTYIGNGNVDGTFVYTGFKPAFILQKNTARAGAGWGMFDSTRTPTNVSKGMLIASSNAVEDTSDAARVDFLSNGFKWRTTDNWFNDDGAATIYMAFAENPFTTSTGIPTPAR